MPRRALFAAALAALWVGSLPAQSSMGELRIQVKDAAGAGMAAHAELVSQASATRLAVDLPSDGHYTFRALPFGSYRLSVTHSGFAALNEAVEIRSAVPLSRELVLSVEAVKTEVTITDSSTLVDTRANNAAYHVGAAELRDRASGTPGRGLIDLIAMQPGWTLEANGVLHPRESEYDVQYVVNGFPLYDNRSPAYAASVGAEEAESMKVYAGGIPAEFGQKLGGVVEVNTQRNTSPGFHGTVIAQGGSFGTESGYASAQYVAGRTTGTLTGEGFLTDRYLDPPTLDNYQNHASNTGYTGTLERDISDADRMRLSFVQRRTWFLVPDDLLQQTAGQRQDRTSGDTEGQFTWQHIFSPSLIGSAGAQVRDVSARLWSNPLSTPILVDQDRGFRETYFKATIAGHKGRHEWKTGVEARFASLREEFDYHIVSYRLNPGNVRIFARNLPADYRFDGTAPDREQAVFAQDAIRFGDLTINAGLRFDHYALLVDETGWSPRAAVSWYVRPLGVVLHGSWDRVFGTPPFENLLVSSAPGTRLGVGFQLPVQPTRGSYWEGGFTRALGSRVRLDANYFYRSTRDAKDDDVLLNTGISFPISFAQAEIRGVEVKLSMPRWGRFSGALSYSNSIGIGHYPISGGLFLDNDSAALLNSTERFPITQDQRNSARAWIRAQITNRVWTAWSASYNSGLPVEDVSDLPPMAFLVAQYGAAIVNQVNYDRGRVLPSFALNASVGIDLWRHEQRSVSLQADVTNLTDRLNLINFAGLLSGTAVAPPRAASVRIRADF
jgi:hypothetical protein